MAHHNILIIGGGTAGITVAARLKRKRAGLDIAIIEPSETHWYQPLWTLVGAGVFDLDHSSRPMASVIPDGVKWIRNRVAGIDAAAQSVQLDDGTRIGYDFLVACPGIQLNWDAIDGLPETLGANGVCSNYGSEHSTYTWEVLQALAEQAPASSPGSACEGPPSVKARFTQPATPVKCGGAPQSAPDFIRQSPLAGEDGWISVDRGTLQHTRFPNVFARGDATDTPNAKTGAAVRKQAPLVVDNLLEVMESGSITSPHTYDGNSSCPLVTGYGKLVLAEFDDENCLTPSFPFDTSRERWSMYVMKTRLLPVLYWKGMLKGRV